MQQNQFQTNNSSSTTGTSCNNNNNNNNTNSSSLNNHQRLPFCGLDSIKGSDNNGGDGIAGGGCLGMGGGGKTNLSFDLNGSTNNMGQHSQHHMTTGGGMLPIDSTSEQFHSLDANDSSCCGDGQFEDDMQALLPKCSRLSRDELSQVSERIFKIFLKEKEGLVHF